MPKRAGFLSQLFQGKPDYALKPADLGDDLLMSIILMTDSINDSHRVFQKMDKDIPKDTPPHRMKFAPIQYADAPKNAEEIRSRKNYAMVQTGARKGALWGVGPTKAYFNVVSPDKEKFSYLIFSNVRKGLFRTFKVVDFGLRLPAMVFASLQILFERAGWKVQSFYETVDNPVAKAAALIVLGPIGFAMNVVGAVVFRGMVFVSRVAAEAVRAPLAVAGAAIGLVFGLVTAAVVAMAKWAGAAKAFHTSGHIILLGVVDGVRPFAPEVANFIHVNYMKYVNNTDASFKLRLPFADMPPARTPAEGTTIDLPWLPLAMFAMAVILVAFLSISTLGIGALAGVPVIPFLFNATGLAAAGFGFAAPAFTIAAVGAITAAGVGLVRGIEAFANDNVSIAKSLQGSVTSAWESYHIAKTAKANLGEAGKAFDLEMQELNYLVGNPPTLPDIVEVEPIVEVKEDRGAGIGSTIPPVRRSVSTPALAAYTNKNLDTVLARSKSTLELDMLSDTLKRHSSGSDESQHEDSPKTDRPGHK